MNQLLDLTTSVGLKEANTLLNSKWGWILFPGAKLAMEVIEWLQKPSDISPEKQAEAAERIIKAGREHGAKKLRFKVDKSVGAKLKGNIEGADIEAALGSDGKMEVEIEYKD